MAITEPNPSPRGAETILVVEDAAGLRKLARDGLERQGYIVLLARDSVEALDVARQNRGPIHLLITDIMLPGITGRELAKLFVAVHPETRVLYMSGHTNSVIAHHGMLEPGIAFLPKPFALDDFWRKVRDILDRP